MTKLEKIDKELSKAREKAAEWQTKIRDLEKQRQEEENSILLRENSSFSPACPSFTTISVTFPFLSLVISTPSNA